MHMLLKAAVAAAAAAAAMDLHPHVVLAPPVGPV